MSAVPGLWMLEFDRLERKRQNSDDCMTAVENAKLSDIQGVSDNLKLGPSRERDS